MVWESRFNDSKVRERKIIKFNLKFIANCHRVDHFSSVRHAVAFQFYSLVAILRLHRLWVRLGNIKNKLNCMAAAQFSFNHQQQRSAITETDVGLSKLSGSPTKLIPIKWGINIAGCRGRIHAILSSCSMKMIMVTHRTLCSGFCIQNASNFVEPLCCWDARAHAKHNIVHR